MNRDIEFRIWADNQFYYKCLVGNTNNIEDNNWACPMVWLEDKKEWVNCDNGIIQQYTGLKDKNGKKIFEGDIVKYKSGGYGVDKKGKEIYKTKKYIIDYDIKMLMFYLKAENEKDDEIIDITDEKKEWIEVIGNIYENKKLLEV